VNFTCTAFYKLTVFTLGTLKGHCCFSFWLRVLD